MRAPSAISINAGGLKSQCGPMKRFHEGFVIGITPPAWRAPRESPPALQTVRRINTKASENTALPAEDPFAWQLFLRGHQLSRAPAPFRNLLSSITYVHIRTSRREKGRGGGAKNQRMSRIRDGLWLVSDRVSPPNSRDAFQETRKHKSLCVFPSPAAAAAAAPPPSSRDTPRRSRGRSKRAAPRDDANSQAITTALTRGEIRGIHA